MAIMDQRVEALINRVALIFAAMATLSLFYAFSSSSSSCRPFSSSSSSSSLPHLPFPRSSCLAAARRPLPAAARWRKLHSSPPWRRRVDSFSALFQPLRRRRLLFNSSRVLCLSAAPGHSAAALAASGVADVTGVDLVDLPPLVKRADPHNLPFFDGVFDLGFSDGLDGALFPDRFVGEMERTVSKGGSIVVVFGGCSSEEDLQEVCGLFRRSKLVNFSNVALDGSELTMMIMRNGVLQV
ncbi:uncharacterized protein LOC144700875 [Wolffia australiana]